VRIPGRAYGPAVEAVSPGHGVVSAKVRIPSIAAMPRERLLALLEGVWTHRLALVTAPAGCGKSTLLAEYARGCGAPVAWYQAECGDADPRTFLTHLEVAARSALGAVPGPWRTEADAALALEGSSPQRLLVVIDDLHALRGTPAEATLERLLHYLPPGIAVVAATRRQPAINLTRLRVASMLLEVDADALRFRLWEVERLFRDFYGEQLRPEELAELARRTEGWAAVLHLFHLATRDRPPEERRRTMAVLGTRLRLVREYLVRNVLDDLDDRTRRFVLWSSVVDRVSGPLCDQLLGSDGGERTLADLERRQLVSQLRDRHGWYRCHEVLRSHLETILVEEVGEQRVREQRRRGGALLEAAGAYTGALGAYCAGDDWSAAARLLGLHGEQLGTDPGWWIEYVPPAVVDEDAWVLLALARRHRAAGRCREAVDVYRRAEARFGAASPAELCGRERTSVAVWMEAHVPLAGSWPAWLRAATVGQPLSVRAQLPGGEVAGHLAGGLSELLAGQLRLARASLDQVMGAPDGGHALRGCARAGLAVVTALEGGPHAGRLLEAAAEEAERDALPWLARLAREALALVVPPRETATDRGADEDLGWGRGLGSLLAGWGAVNRGEARVECLEEAAHTFDALHAPVLECWARALLAVASVRRGADASRATAERAEAMARALGVAGARALALAALAELDPAGDARVAATRIADDCGLALPSPPAPALPAAAPAAPPPPPRPRPPGGAAGCAAGASPDQLPGRSHRLRWWRQARSRHDQAEGPVAAAPSRHARRQARPPRGHRRGALAGGRHRHRPAQPPRRRVQRPSAAGTGRRGWGRCRDLPGGRRLPPRRGRRRPGGIRGRPGRRTQGAAGRRPGRRT
jgi:hypothetical protein